MRPQPRTLRARHCGALSSRRPCSEFILAHYKALKAANPKLPVLIRECAGVEPRLTARFGAPLRPHVCAVLPLTRAAGVALGLEEEVQLSGLSAAAVAKKLEALLAK